MHGADDDAGDDGDQRQRRLRDRTRGGDVCHAATAAAAAATKAATGRPTRTAEPAQKIRPGLKIVKSLYQLSFNPNNVHF